LSNPTPAVGNAYCYSDRFTQCDDFTDSDAERDGQPGNTNPHAFMCAGYHRIEHADDHAAQLGLVQQRHGPHRQQLLESV
jgi:hypothetical protein